MQTNLPKNVLGFVSEFTAGMSSQQHASFWKKLEIPQTSEA